MGASWRLILALSVTCAPLLRLVHLLARQPRYYYLHGHHESGYTDQDIRRLKAATETFKAMATRSELEILRPAGCKASGAVTADTVGRGDAARARVLETLDALIRKR